MFTIQTLQGSSWLGCACDKMLGDWQCNAGVCRETITPVTYAPESASVAVGPEPETVIITNPDGTTQVVSTAGYGKKQNLLLPIGLAALAYYMFA